MKHAEYQGAYPFFPFESVRTYPISSRTNKVTADSMIQPPAVLADERPPFDSPELDAVVSAILEARSRERPVMVFTGAHLVKNGFGTLMIDLMRRGLVSLVATNAAGLTHDFELALIGATSEAVPNALPEGRFGMCLETPQLMNRAFRAALSRGMGAGEALGRLILGEPMPETIACARPDVSIAAAGIRHGVPVTMHAAIGTDIIDQHLASDPAAKGGASGLDFGVFAAMVCELAGGVFLDIGSSVQGPEVFLKAVSMAANVGHSPSGLTCASFDIRPARLSDVDDERTHTYYYRDVKSVVHRIPAAFGGRGHYIQGDHLLTVPALYWKLVKGHEREGH
jgi:hypothetical protein